ncbi:MAG: YggT family protein [Gemmatimonadota bacterium]|jgi:YggT family protein|nr:hypothetical protein [Gemmatimonadota bacterium]MDP6529558.1 YggT family protein [Gemmatimonadota bacterium]MDP6803542.1 YggT family protein [Gemmatimonadota bacterium]MDP7031918.1 YggT family protein [Gemmatimonadota bacterium]
MFVVANAVGALAGLLDILATLYVYVLIGNVICSWVGADPFNPVVRAIQSLSEPVLMRIRRYVPPLGGLDFSVLVAILLVQVVVKSFLVGTLREGALKLS